MVPVIVPIYAAILALIFVFLSVRVIMLRASAKVAIGHGGNPSLERRMRVQANFAEYVPLALLLLTFLEMQSHSRYLIHILALALLIGRIFHAYTVSQDNENLRLRAVGVLTTFAVLVIAAIVLLLNGLRAIG
jgi:uncharacterized membrane protein YecN with MAPEG domain